MSTQPFSEQGMKILNAIDSQLHDDIKAFNEYCARYGEKVRTVNDFVKGWDSGKMDSSVLESSLKKLNEYVIEEFRFNEREARQDEEVLKRIGRVVDLDDPEQRRQLDSILRDFSAFSEFIKKLNSILSEQKKFFANYGGKLGLERRNIIELVHLLKQEQGLLFMQGYTGKTEKEMLDSLVADVGHAIDSMNKTEEEFRDDPYRINMDLHFHPNLSPIQFFARRKARAIWKRASELKIDVLISSEHSFKDAEYAYNIMFQTKPPNIHLFAGVEVLCIENTEVLVFTDAEPMKPEDVPEGSKEYAGRNPFYFNRAFTANSAYHFEDVIRIAKQRGYAVFVPHPYLMNGGFIDVFGKGNVKKGEELLANILTKYKVGSGIHSNSFRTLNELLGMTPLPELVDRVERKKGVELTTRQRMENIKYVPESMRQHAAFFGGGGDAHTPAAMETVLSMPLPKQKSLMTREEVYKTIITNASNRTKIIPMNVKVTPRSVLTLLATSVFVGVEGAQVRWGHLMRKLRVRKTIKLLKQALLDPNSNIEEIIALCEDVPAHHIRAKVWDELSEEQRKTAVELAKKRSAS